MSLFNINTLKRIKNTLKIPNDIFTAFIRKRSINRYNMHKSKMNFKNQK